MQVTKRDGTVVDFDVTKIKQVIEWATEEISDVSPIELESRANYSFYNKISTRKIQEYLVTTALGMISPDESNWSYVAGRLLYMNYWKDSVLNRGYKYTRFNFFNHVQSMISRGLYDATILDYYSMGDVVELGHYLQLKQDLSYSHPSMTMFIRRYLLPDEMPQEMYMVVSMWLASVELVEDRVSKAIEFYKLLSNKQLSLATPILLNLRKPNPNLASCFVLEVDDSLDGLTHSWNQVAQISKRAGGVGCYLGNIRATGSEINKVPGVSGGVLPWVRILNDIALAVNQQGKRSGAVTIGLDIWHYDLLDFLDCQTETGEMRLKSFDIFPQVIVPDLFMKYVAQNKQWTMFDPREVFNKYKIQLTNLWGKEFEEIYHQLEQDETLQLTKVINARSLLMTIQERHIATGLPYLFFKDTVNSVNPNSGLIKQGNLCQESFSSFDLHYTHCCNLASLNLTVLDESDIPQVTQLSIEILDNLIELATPPIKEAKAHNSKYRTLGLGIMGLADYLAKNDTPYTDKAKPVVSDILETIAYHSYLATHELGKKRGNFTAFEESKLSKGIILGKLFSGDSYVEVPELLDAGFSQDEIEEIAANDELKALLFS